jgi:DNA-directed RNA polymerase subunit RPC12/RpoP
MSININMKKFTKNIEDFICFKCGAEVKGNGYTNHCPSCLWSKHVDVNPGDRVSDCGGEMEPIRVENDKQVFKLVHKCITCGHEKRNELVKGDSFDVAVKLMQKVSEG